MDAEQCVLGAMMMSKDAIADVVETLRGSDFYRPAHEQIYDAITDLYGRGEPVDALMVSNLLGKRGALIKIGGADYLHTLLASVSVAANAGYYAAIVREKAVLRRLVDASVRIGQMSYAGEGDVDDIVDRAQAEVYSVTDRKASERSLRQLDRSHIEEFLAGNAVRRWRGRVARDQQVSPSIWIQPVRKQSNVLHQRGREDG